MKFNEKNRNAFFHLFIFPHLAMQFISMNVHRNTILEIVTWIFCLIQR